MAKLLYQGHGSLRAVTDGGVVPIWIRSPGRAMICPPT